MWNFGNHFRGILRTLASFAGDRYLIFYCGSWILIRATRKLGYPIPILNNWLTDFIFVPLICYIALSIGHLLLGRNRTPLFYPLYQVMILSSVVSIVFEILLPDYTTYNTGDPLDAISYFLGGFFYRYIHQTSVERRITGRNAGS